MNDYKLLLDEAPMLIIRELAFAIGLPQAIILQQIHYWVKINERATKNYRDGYYWTYNSYEHWQSQFFFWSLATVKRYFRSLEKSSYIICGNFNRLAIDRTKWYRINYNAISERVKMTHSDFLEATAKGSKLSVGATRLIQPLPETTTEITTETKILEIWTNALEKLRGQVSESNFRTWLKDIVPLSFDGEAFVVGAKSTFVSEYLNLNQRSFIESALTEIVGEPVEFVCQVTAVVERKVKERETISDKIRDLLNAGREIAGDEKTDQSIAFLDDEPREEEQLKTWLEELEAFSYQGERTNDK